MSRPKHDEFIAHGDVMFRVTETGIHPAPHCPNCKRPMFASDTRAAFQCYVCNRRTPMDHDTVDELVAELAQKHQQCPAHTF